MQNNNTFRLSMLSASLAALFSPALYAAGAGQVEFATAGVNAVGANGQSRPLSKGSEVQPGETIDTGTGRAQLRFTDGGYVSLQPQTQFRLEQYGYDKDDPKKNGIVMNLLKGGLRTITGLIGKTNREGYKLQTATATVGIRGTEFSITGFPDGSIVFNVADGAVDVTNQRGSTTVTGGQSLSVASSTANPTKTEEKPFLPPVVSAEQTKQPLQADAVQQATAPVITPPVTQPVTPTPPPPPPLLGNYESQWRAVSYQTGTLYPMSSAGYGPSVFTVSPSGHVTSMGFTDPSGTPQTMSLGSASAQSYGNDGVMAWGRWSGGPTAGTGIFGEGNTFGANDPLHYVAGLPVTNMPTSGTATYNMYGGTAPTCTGPTCGGAISVGSSLMVNFGNNTGSFSLSVKNATDNVQANMNGALIFDASKTNFASNGLVQGTSANANSGSPYGNLIGFLAGPGASHAGAIYQVQYLGNGQQTPTSIQGAAVYKQ